MKIAPQSRRARLLVSFVALVIFGGGGFLILQRDGGSEATAAAAEESEVASEEEEKRVPVELDVARAADIPDVYPATGSLKARRAIDLKSKVAGQVTRLLVEEGDRVESGQLLVELDHREQVLKVDEARVRAETARTQLQRMQDMAQRGLETDRALEEAAQAYEVQKAQHEMEEVRLEDHFIRAPYAGTVTRRDVELGQTVQSGEALLGLAEISTLEVELHLPESVVRRLALGQEVEIRADVDDEQVLAGRVHRISPVVDAATSTVKVTLEVRNPSGAARVGSFVRARITTDVRRDVVSVPRKALVAEAGASFVFVAEADTVRKVEVETGYASRERIEITRGVELEDRVVVVGQGGLRTGSHVEPIEESPDDTAARPDEPKVAEVAQRR